MMFRSGRTLKLMALVVLFYIIYLTTNQYLFEKFLRRRYLTFEDFPKTYTHALQTSITNNSPLEFDHSLFPSTANSSSSIPPTIHFIWFKDLYATQLDRPDHPSHIPHEGSHAPQLCAEHNPSFTINVWNASAARQLLADYYSWFLPTYDGYKYPIQRVDAFKYFVMYHHGGVYMDLDIACRRPLEPLLQVPAWFPKAEPFGVNNDLFAARKGHGIMRMMIERLEARNWNLIFPYVTIFWSTGPQFVSDMVRRWYRKGFAKGYVQGQSKHDSGPLTLPSKRLYALTVHCRSRCFLHASARVLLREIYIFRTQPRRDMAWRRRSRCLMARRSTLDALATRYGQHHSLFGGGVQGEKAKASSHEGINLNPSSRLFLAQRKEQTT